MLTYRFSGVLLFLSGLLAGFGHIAALLSWRGLYSFTDNRLSDYTVTECQILRDNLGTRYVCNPAFLVTNAAYVASGLVIFAAAAVMWIAASRDGHRSVRIPAVLLGVAGVAMSACGLVPYNVSAFGHDLAMLLLAVSLWVVMAYLAGIGRARRLRGSAPHPLIYGAYVPLTRLMLTVSVVGLLALLLLGPRGLPGAYERMAYDTLTVWIMVIGVCMYSLGGAADQESRRVAELEAAGVPGMDPTPRRYPGFGAGWGRRRDAAARDEADGARDESAADGRMRSDRQQD